MCASRENGFRSGLDAVMLAAAVPAEPAKRAGTGGGRGHRQPVPGGAGAGHLPSPAWRSIPSLAALADRQCRRQWHATGVRFVAADIFALPPELKRDFDHVFCNPPFHGEGQASPDAARAARPDGRRPA